MEVIAVFNQKGGVGKTCTSVSLASVLAARGYKTLIIDLDPQCSVAKWLDVTTEGDADIYSVLAEQRPACQNVYGTGWSNLDCIPGGRKMTQFERVVAASEDLNVIQYEIVKNALAGLKLHPETSDYAFIILDTPGSVNLIGRNALTAATFALIPIEPEPLAIQELKPTIAAIQWVKSKTNPALEILGVVLTNVDKRKLSQRQLVQEVRDIVPDRATTTEIRTNVKLSDAPAHKLPINIYAPKSTASKDFEALVDELIARLPTPPVPVAEKQVVNS